MRTRREVATSGQFKPYELYENVFSKCVATECTRSALMAERYTHHVHRCYGVNASCMQSAEDMLLVAYCVELI